MTQIIEPKKAGAPLIPIYEFQKEDKTQTIALDNLSLSIRRESGLAGIRDIPMQFWALYAAIINLVEENNFNYTEQDIYVQNNSSKAYLTDTEKGLGYDNKRAPVNRWRFDKIITTIQLPQLLAGASSIDSMEARNAAIGLTLNKEGITIAFGMNVRACTNFNVMGGTILRSYKFGDQDGLPWELLYHKLKQWISGMNQIWKVQNEIMHEMKSYQLPTDIPIIEDLVGDLYIAAIKQAYFKGGFTPFDTHELSNFVKEMIQSQKTADRLANLWDVYNWGTSIMKPGIVDIGEISNNSNVWSDYLLKKFQLNNVPHIITIDE